MKRVAFLVGNSDFAPGSGLANLRYPPADVEELAKIFGQAEVGRYSRIVSLVNKPKDEILETLDTVLDEERGACFLFYYSGHGKPSDGGRLFLAASNTKENKLAATGISFADILHMKDEYGYGRFIAILDRCFAGLGSPHVKGSADDQFKAYAQGHGVFFLGAANATETAKEDLSLGHGVLTGAIIEGLTSGLADVDNDGRVTGSDLFTWCREFAGQRGSHKPVQVNKVAHDDLVIAFARRRLAPDAVERAQLILTTPWADEVMSTDEIGVLRHCFSSCDTVPPAGSLADAFLAYSGGEISRAEFLKRLSDWRALQPKSSGPGSPGGPPPPQPDPPHTDPPPGEPISEAQVPALSLRSEWVKLVGGMFGLAGLTVVVGLLAPDMFTAKPAPTTSEEVTLGTFGSWKVEKTNYKNALSTWFSCEALTTPLLKNGSYGKVRLDKSSGGTPKLTVFTEEILDQGSNPIISVLVNGRTQRITGLTDYSGNWIHVTDDNYTKLRDALTQGSKLTVDYTDLNNVKQSETVAINGFKAAINKMISDCEF